MTANRFVTACLRLKTHCHHNFGYYFLKYMIPRAIFRRQTGLRYALQSKLVY